MFHVHCSIELLHAINYAFILMLYQ